MHKNKIRTLLMIVLAAVVALLLPTQQLLAAPAPQETPDSGYDVMCEGGVCSVSLGLDQATAVAPEIALRAAPSLLRAAQDNIDFLPDDLGLAVTDRVTLTLPVGNIDMLDANLQVEFDEDQQVDRFYGTAAVPFPTLGLFPDAELVLPGRAKVGFDTGENLAYLGAPLDPERRYFALHFGGDDPDAAENATFDFTGAEGENSLTLIIDPASPFVYLVGNILLVDVSELLLADQIAGGQLLPMIPNLFPVPERVGGRVALLVTDDLDDLNLEIGGGYAVDSGSLGRRLGIDVKPIAIEGAMALDREGLTVNGVTHSSVQSGALFDGKGTVEFHIPFTGNPADAYAQAGGSVESSIIGLAREGETDVSLADFADRLAELDGPERMAQLRNRMAGAVAGATGQAGSLIGSSGRVVSGAVSGAASSAANAATGVGGAATNVLSNTVTVVASLPVTGVISNTVSGVTGVMPDSVSDGFSTSVDWAARVADGAYGMAIDGVCNWFGRCTVEPVAQGE